MLQWCCEMLLKPILQASMVSFNYEMPIHQVEVSLLDGQENGEELFFVYWKTLLPSRQSIVDECYRVVTLHQYSSNSCVWSICFHYKHLCQVGKGQHRYNCHGFLTPLESPVGLYRPLERIFLKQFCQRLANHSVTSNKFSVIPS